MIRKLEYKKLQRPMKPYEKHRTIEVGTNLTANIAYRQYLVRSVISLLKSSLLRKSQNQPRELWDLTQYIQIISL